MSNGNRFCKNCIHFKEESFSGGEYPIISHLCKNPLYNDIVMDYVLGIDNTVYRECRTINISGNCEGYEGKGQRW